MAKSGAKPAVTNYGYRDGVNSINQVKIATSNLFIETGTVPVDYMTGAVFDGIGGNEFINSGSAEIILQSENSLVQDASDVREAISSSRNEKQADGTPAIMAQFELSLSNYLPKKVNSIDFVGAYDVGDILGTSVDTSFPEKNAYFDDLYEYIYIELENVGDDEEVEVEFITSVTPTSGII
jgi:hypothetical protein